MHQVALHSRILAEIRVWIGLQRSRERKADAGAVLMYHGIATRQRPSLLDEYTIDVPSLRAHLDFFGRTHQFVPLRHIVDRLRTGEPIPPDWIAITLDDALLNQVVTAGEVLSGIPWALAVPVGLIDSGRSIWTYEFRFLLLECWPFATIPSPLQGAPELPTSSVAARGAAVREIVPQLFHIADDQRTAYLERIVDLAGRTSFLARMCADGRFTLATWSQLRGLHASGVELLSHGWLHRPQNEAVSKHALVEEIAESRRVMGERLGEEPRGFALPHGARAPITDDLIASAGYSYCLSSRPGRLARGTKVGDIPRFAAEYPLSVLRVHLASE